jgi:hypothetical protein
LPGRRDTPDHRDRPPASGGRRGATAGASKGSQVEWAIRRTGKVSGIAGPRIERLGGRLAGAPLTGPRARSMLDKGAYDDKPRE